MVNITEQLSIICFGQGQFPEDDTRLGTYWKAVAFRIGRCHGLDRAIKVAERRVSNARRMRRYNWRRFSAERIIIEDSRQRLVLGGQVRLRTIE